VALFRTLSLFFLGDVHLFLPLSYPRFFFIGIFWIPKIRYNFSSFPNALPFYPPLGFFSSPNCSFVLGFSPISSTLQPVSSFFFLLSRSFDPHFLSSPFLFFRSPFSVVLAPRFTELFLPGYSHYFLFFSLKSLFPSLCPFGCFTFFFGRLFGFLSYPFTLLIQICFFFFSFCAQGDPNISSPKMPHKSCPHSTPLLCGVVR